MKIFIATATTLGLLMGFGIGNEAFAGDCRQVKFSFTNKTASRIKVKKIEIKGNDGSWTENIANKTIDTNKSYTTNKRRLNKLDSGKKGNFKVLYDSWDGANSKWRSRSKSFNGQMCSDGKTFRFRI